MIKEKTACCIVRQAVEDLCGMLEDAPRQHSGASHGQGDDEVEDRTGGALDEDGFQRLDVGDALHAGDSPFFAVATHTRSMQMPSNQFITTRNSTACQ